ncbi:MAG: DUF1028 domain-containing protein [Candidatus Palauibacterales bacterium]|nr:DUF1028 domain-containing protein [Candidatus Palauibacterales bacterium]
MGRLPGALAPLALIALSMTAVPARGAAQAGGTTPAAASAPDTTPSPAAPGTAVGSPVFGWALLAYDASSGELGIVAASDRFSAGSGVPYLDRRVGAVAVLGRLDATLGSSVLGSLRGGATPQGVVGAGAADPDSAAGGAAQVGALTPACQMAERTPESLVPWSGSSSGGSGANCWMLMGTGLSDSTLLPRLAAAYGRSGGDLLDRFLAVLDAAGRSEEDAPRSRSAVLWITAPPGSSLPLGRGDLRLQVDDVQRPSDALREVADAGRADALASRAAVAVDRGDYQGALDLSKQALDVEPATALGWLARGRALLFLNRADEAEQAFQRMLEVDPWLLHVLGNPATGRIRPGVIPYRPRLLQRLDVYRRAFWPDVTFPADSAIGAG